MRRSVLQPWIGAETGCDSREALDRWQLERLREAVAYAKRMGGTNIWAAVAISIMFLVVYGAAFLFLYAFGML